MRRQLALLMQSHGIAQLQDALVAQYVHAADIPSPTLPVISDAIGRARDEKAALSDVRQSLPQLTLEELTTAFELLIPSRDRKLNGAFFTPPRIADYIVAQGLSAGAETACDPSCGCGAILTRAAAAIADRDSTTITHVAHHNVFGVDLCDYNIQRASILLALLALSRGEQPTDWQPNLRAANSLGADWEQLFPQVTAAGGFAAIIGNPPYVRFQHLSQQVRDELKAWETIATGNYNLYFAFFELGRNLLRPDGQFSFIVPNSFFGLSAAKALRGWFQRTRFAREILDFGHDLVFEDASVYTCIVSGDLHPRDHLTYSRASADQPLGTAACTAVAYRSLTEKPWDLIPAERAATLTAIRRPHLPTLGQLVRIRGGLATLRDKLYMVDAPSPDEPIGKTHGDARFEIEREITIPCLRISDFKTDAALAANTRRIIYPYRAGDDGSIKAIPERELAERFPGAYAYLTAIRDDLAQRDRGAKQYETWYAYGRTQGLLPVGPAVFTPIYADQPRFLRDDAGGAVFLNGLALLPQPDAERHLGVPLTMQLLQALLNASPVLGYYMAALANHISGGYAHYKTALLNAFPIPYLTERDAADLVSASAGERPRLIADLYGIPLADLH